MKKTIYRTSILIGIVVLCSTLGANSIPLAPTQYQKMLRVGMDVDWAKTRSGRVAAMKAHKRGINVPALFKARGFDHVRIRIREDVLDTKPSAITQRRLLDEITILVNDCLKAGITPILAYRLDALKHDPNNNKILAHEVVWWKTIATRFRGYSYQLAYDLVIEPAKKIKKYNDRLNLYYKKANKVIHSIDPKRIVIVAANKISNPYELKNLIVPTPSDYVMAEWHFYAAGLKLNHPKKQWTTGTAFEKKLIDDKIKVALDWSRHTGIKTWVGAWMPTNYNKKGTRNRKASDGSPDGGDHVMAEQIHFATYMSRSLQRAGIPFAINSDTKYFNRETNQWYPSKKHLLDVILKEY